jgi:hypothetical protein
MLHTESYDILFSEGQPEIFLKQLLAVLQVVTDALEIKSPSSSLKVLIIDADIGRASFISSLLDATGYRSINVATALDAFTLFLKGSYIPHAIILNQGYVPDPLFLQRLLQRNMYMNGFKVPLVRLTHDATLANTARHPSVPLQAFSSAEHSPHTGPLEQIEREKIILTGQNTGRYRIETLLGGGLQGNVYRAYDRLREQEVALKAVQVNSMPYALIRTSAEDINIFQQEFDLLGTLDHAHIMAPLNVGRSYISGSPFVFKTMPYCSERSLALWLSRREQKAFSTGEIVPLIVQLADTLQFVHDCGILYQNFKLSNLLIRNQTNDIRNLQIMLADFPFEQDGSFFSRTPDAFPYMAPERWQGWALPASDQYALAALTYELLTGHPPFRGQSEYTMRFLHLNMRPQIPVAFSSVLSPAINHVLLQALEKRPEDRFPTVATFASTLQRYCS